MDSLIATEIINILEKEIRYDLSSKLDVFFNKHGIKVDPEWKPSDPIAITIKDTLDKQMQKECVLEEIGSVDQTKDAILVPGKILFTTECMKCGKQYQDLINDGPRPLYGVGYSCDTMSCM